MAEQLFDPLLAELRNVIERVDPVPESVVSAAKASFIWRTVDAELAELVTDSLLASAAVRSATGARLLTFEGPGVEVEVEIADTGKARRLTGQLVPVGPAVIVVRWNGGSAEATADEMGRFTVADVPAGAVSLAITTAGAGAERHVVTSWASI
jgi:hypothetical protein